MIMQLVQILLTLYVFLIPIQPSDSFPLSKNVLRWLRRYNKYIVYGCTITYNVVIPAISMAYWVIEWNINTDPQNLVRAWVLVYPISGICQMIYFFWQLQHAIVIMNEGYQGNVLSIWENRVNDTINSGLFHDPETKIENFTYKNLVESVAIFRIRPDWYDEANDTRGEGTRLARTKQEYGHKVQFESVEPMDACKKWLKELKEFCSFMGYVGSEG